MAQNVSGGFKTAINNYLQQAASDDELFAKTLQKPNKNLDECCIYILNEVKKSGQQGFADEEIFKMARHYYDEDGIEIGDKNITANVVVNHHVELSEEEKAQARKAAMDRAIAQEQARISKKPAPKPAKPVEKQTEGQQSLF